MQASLQSQSAAMNSSWRKNPTPLLVSTPFASVLHLIGVFMESFASTYWWEEDSLTSRRSVKEACEPRRRTTAIMLHFLAKVAYSPYHGDDRSI